ncbi:hypothetical protein V5O48_003350 [Marasmius crinis-equi]|uniref:HMG box domain-containing protein n=1 Tax=Marasmius crinis-equi TaxID=585013 RepID=A0ABR3FTX2_9AGAR
MNIIGWAPEHEECNSSLNGAASSSQAVDFDPLQSQESLFMDQPARLAPGSPLGSEYSRTATPESPGQQPAGKRGEPDWVPRPQNSFFIFRGEFIKKHQRGGSEAGTASPDTADKSLSRRAGDAWKRLSPEEKAEYGRRADAEKVRHAREHPDYRYRPTRTGKRKNRRPDTQPHKKMKMIPSTASSNSRLLPARHKALRAHTASPGHIEGPFGTFQPHPQAPQEPLLESRRRSISVPPPFAFQRHQQPHLALGAVPHGLRRAMSYREPSHNTPGHLASSSMMYDELIYPEDAVSPATEFDYRHLPAHPYHPGPFQRPIHPEFTYNVSPLATVSASLANWNGHEIRHAPVAIPPPLPPPLLLNQSWTAESTLGDASSPSSNGASQVHSPAGTQPPVLLQPELEYIPDDHQPAIAHEFPLYVPVHDTPLGEYSLEAAARASALEHFDAGLAQSASHGNGEYLYFDMPIAEEQKLFEGMVEFH